MTEDDPDGGRLAPKRQGSRATKTSMTVWIEPETLKLTKIAALTLDMKLQEFVEQALREAVEKAGVKL